MKIIAMIPARYSASRFPGKLMKKLGDKTVIRRTYEATFSTGLFDAVYVVTDNDLIFKEIENIGGNVIKSQKEHESGSDRIAEAVEQMDVDIIVNVQGDEPFTEKEPLEKVIQVFKDDLKQQIDVVSLMQELKKWEDINNPNFVKVVTNKSGFALFFSRSTLPYPRDKNIGIRYFEHIGIYGFRKEALMDFYQSPMLPLEATEKIECLRFLEYGKTIKMLETNYMGVEIDTPEDLIRAERLIKK